VTLMQLFLGSGYFFFPLSESFHQCSIVKASFIHHRRCFIFAPGNVVKYSTSLSHLWRLCCRWTVLMLFSKDGSAEITNSEKKTESPSLFQEQPNEGLLLRYSP